MIYALKNNTSNTIILNNTFSINSSGWVTLYDSSSYAICSNILDIKGSLSIITGEPTNNLNYCLSLGFIQFFIDGNLQTYNSFYSWFDGFLHNYSYYSQFISAGIVQVNLDNDNGTIIIGNRNILVSDLPSNINASLIANGSVSNLQFETLAGINTNQTIQQQLDSKLAINAQRVFTYTQTTPSTYWIVSHNLNCIPVCAVFDSTGEEILTTIIPLDNNTLAVRFSVPASGYCSIVY